jgi:serine/threonine-protein kinase
MAFASGAAIAGYTVARRLGSGRTGEVYLVQDPRSARWDALKVLAPELSADEEFRRRFRHEAAIAANLRHPHILEVHRRGEFEAQLWFAMDYVNATDAAQLMTDRFPAVAPVGEVLALITAVAAALDVAHERGMLHRDVKPANILLTNPGDGERRILLTDFGIAPRLGQPGRATGAHRRNTPLGTVAYAAPEVLMDMLTDTDADRPADQYALAATAFHLLTGAPPVEHCDPAAAARRLLDNAPPRLSDQRPELGRLDSVFARALAKKPADRFESCCAFADAVNEQVGVSTGDRSPEAVSAADDPARPAHAERDHPQTTRPPSHFVPVRKPERPAPQPQGPAPAAPARRRDDAATHGKPSSTAAAKLPSAPPRTRPSRSVLLIAAAAVLAGGLGVLGVVIGRKAESTSAQAGPTTRSAPGAGAAASATSTTPAVPVPMDGTYRLDVHREKRTFNYVADPQPPNASTWWAFRSSCVETACTAAAIQLDDDEHMHAMSSGGGHLVMLFGDGQWQSEPETTEHPCVGKNGIAQIHTTTMVLSLRPEPQGDLAGEETVTVKTNECGQRASVIRTPAVASRSGDVPAGVTVPDPLTMTNPASPRTTTR